MQAASAATFHVLAALAPDPLETAAALVVQRKFFFLHKRRILSSGLAWGLEKNSLKWALRLAFSGGKLETLVGESKPLSVCRRTLQRDGRMRMDISKRTPDGQTVSMTAIATRARPPRLVHQC